MNFKFMEAYTLMLDINWCSCCSVFCVASCTFLLSTVQLRALSTFVDMCVSIFHFVISAMLLSVVSQPLSNCLIIHKQYIMKYSSTSHDTTQEHDTVKPQYIKDDDDVKHVNTHCNKDIKCWQLDCTQQKQINVPGLFQSILLKKNSHLLWVWKFPSSLHRSVRSSWSLFLTITIWILTPSGNKT